MAPAKPSAASQARLSARIHSNASRPSSAAARSASAAVIRPRRETRSASTPAGNDNNRKGKVCAVCR